MAFSVALVFLLAGVAAEQSVPQANGDGQSSCPQDGSTGACMAEQDKTSLLQTKAKVEIGTDRSMDHPVTDYYGKTTMMKDAKDGDCEKNPIPAGVDCAAKVNNGEFCWRNTFPRGAGMLPGKCTKPGYVPGKIAGLFPTCVKSSGVARVACKPGWRDHVLYCQKPAISRLLSAGIPLMSKAYCERQYTQGCEKHVFSKTLFGNVGEWSPKCKRGYHAFTPYMCYPDGLSQVDCREKYGHNSFFFGGNACSKSIDIGDYDFTGASCEEGFEMQAGLCYPKCPQGSTGIGPVCWYKPPAGFTECGMGASKGLGHEGQQTCRKIISTQVFSVAKMVLDLATLGAAHPASVVGEHAKEAAEAGLEHIEDVMKIVETVEQVSSSVDGAWAGLKAVTEAAREHEVTADNVKETAVAVGNTVAVVLGGTEFVEGLDALANGDNAEDQVRGAAKIAAKFDPSGISGVVGAFTFAKCDHPLHAAFGKDTRDYFRDHAVEAVSKVGDKTGNAVHNLAHRIAPKSTDRLAKGASNIGHKTADAVTRGVDAAHGAGSAIKGGASRAFHGVFGLLEEDQVE